MFSCLIDCLFIVAAFHGHVYHGLVREDATEGDNVELDSPLYVRRRNGLTSGECCCKILQFKNKLDRFLSFQMQWGQASMQNFLCLQWGLDSEAKFFFIQLGFVFDHLEV